MLNGNYKPYVVVGKVILINTAKKITYSQKDFQILDDALSTGNLMFIPEVWANSINTLPITKTDIPFILNKINETKSIIKTSITGKNTDFLYIAGENINKVQTFSISINDSESIINCDTESGRLLIPLDNFPSWLLNENIKEIQIISKYPTKIKEIKFYNKNENIR